LPTVYRYLFPAMWFAWAVYWWISSRAVKATVQRESPTSRFAYIVPLIAAGYLLAARSVRVPFLDERFVARSPWTFGVASALTAAGLLFAVWARRHLGANWSGTVTIKQGHELIVTGPYAFVRHPIYTGLLVAIAGSALAVGEWRGVAAIALAALSFAMKLRLEERFMEQQFGDAYREYRRRVPALVPFI